MLEYANFKKLPLETQKMLLMMQAKDFKKPFRAYTFKYRGKNAFGALRLNHIIAIGVWTRLQAYSAISLMKMILCWNQNFPTPPDLNPFVGLLIEPVWKQNIPVNTSSLPL
jgi:hypothetical protein